MKDYAKGWLISQMIEKKGARGRGGKELTMMSVLEMIWPVTAGE